MARIREWPCLISPKYPNYKLNARLRPNICGPFSNTKRVVLSLGHPFLWDVLSLGPYVWGSYVNGTFCPMGRFVPWDVLSHGIFCLCTGTGARCVWICVHCVLGSITYVICFYIKKTTKMNRL